MNTQHFFPLYYFIEDNRITFAQSRGFQFDEYYTLLVCDNIIAQPGLAQRDFFIHLF